MLNALLDHECIQGNWTNGYVDRVVEANKLSNGFKMLKYAK